MKYKKCTYCEWEFELDQFNKREASLDGFQPICKKCEKKIKEEAKEKDPEKIRSQGKNRTRKYREDEVNLKKHRCRCLARKAVKEGLLILQPCECCGCEKVQMHHESYEIGDELKVNCLCLKCHHKRHEHDDLDLNQWLQFEKDKQR